MKCAFCDNDLDPEKYRERSWEDDPRAEMCDACLAVDNEMTHLKELIAAKDRQILDLKTEIEMLREIVKGENR